MGKPLLIAALALAAASGSAQMLVFNSTGPNSGTLTLSGHTTAWWYKQALPNAGTCTSVNAGTDEVTLSGLSALTPYIYRAYSSAGCSTDLLAIARFHTAASRSKLRDTWSIGETVHISLASRVVRLNVNTQSNLPTYAVTFARSGLVNWWSGSGDIDENCHADTFFIPTGNGDLGDRAQVRIHERALEMLDMAKLALLTDSPVEVAVDITQSKRFRVLDYCAILSITLVPKP